MTFRAWAGLLLAVAAGCGPAPHDPATPAVAVTVEPSNPAAEPPDPPAPHATKPAEPSPAGPADPARAELLFEEGRQLMAAGRYAEACVKLAGSERQDPAVGTLLNLGTCEEKIGDKAGACAHYRTAQQLAQAAGQTDRANFLLAKIGGLGCK